MKALVTFISSIVGFVTSFFQNLVNFFKIIGQAVSALPSYLGEVPTLLVSFIVIGISVAIVMRIVGREG